MTKTISHDTYLKALGLFTLMCSHADEATKFDNALCKLLGYDDPYYSGHISDHCYAGLSGVRPPFMELLKREGFEVEVPAPVIPQEPMGYTVRNNGSGVQQLVYFASIQEAEEQLSEWKYGEHYEIVPLYEGESS